jgi:hypothetical protein
MDKKKIDLFGFGVTSRLLSEENEEWQPSADCLPRSRGRSED